MKRIIILLSVLICTSFVFADTLFTKNGKRMEIEIIKVSNDVLTFKLIGDEVEYEMPLSKIQKIIDAHENTISLSRYISQDDDPLVNYNGKVVKQSTASPQIKMVGCRIYVDGRRVSNKKVMYSFQEYCKDAYIIAGSYDNMRGWNRASNNFMIYGAYGAAIFGFMNIGQTLDPEGTPYFDRIFGKVTLACAGVVALGVVMKGVCYSRKVSIMRKAVRTYNNKCYQPEIALDAYIAPGQVGIALNF